jgi:ABC-type cobalt transport system substrate-binding protein
MGHMAERIEAVIALRERPRDAAEQFGVGGNDAAYQMCAPEAAMQRLFEPASGHCKELLFGCGAVAAMRREM